MTYITHSNLPREGEVFKTAAEMAGDSRRTQNAQGRRTALSMPAFSKPKS